MRPPTIIILAILLLASAAPATAQLAANVTLACDFPAAEAVQKVKPGKKGNISDGMIRIGAEKIIFEICPGCAWKKTKARWKVTPDHYLLHSDSGISFRIARQDGSAVFTLTAAEDAFYFSGQVESRGQCQILAPSLVKHSR